MLIKHANLYKFSKSLIWLFNQSWLEQISFTVLFTHAESQLLLLIVENLYSKDLGSGV